MALFFVFDAFNAFDALDAFDVFDAFDRLLPFSVWVPPILCSTHFVVYPFLCSTHFVFYPCAYMGLSLCILLVCAFDSIQFGSIYLI